MADTDSIITNSNVISGCFRLPKVPIPANIVESADGRISFKIQTHNGEIDVTGYGRRSKWKCTGNVSALVTAGFIRAEWCPGLPGNNKIRQTVLFEADGPRMVYGNRRGATMSAPFIVITRVSANKFVVEVPTTKEQDGLISQAMERGIQRMQDERRREESNRIQMKRRQDKDERYSRYYKSPSLFKDESVSILKDIFNFSMGQLSGKYEFSEYGETTMWIDEQSMQDVLCAGSRLFESIRVAKVVCRRKEPHLALVK